VKWVYIVVMINNTVLSQPFGMAVGDNEHDCWEKGVVEYERLYHKTDSSIALCVSNDEVDEKYPRLSWM